MTRDERLARRRTRGDARARVAAIPRTIDPFTKKPHPRFFELRASISRLSRRFGFGFARAPRPI